MHRKCRGGIENPMGSSVAGEPCFSPPLYMCQVLKFVPDPDRFVLFMTFLMIHRVAFTPGKAASSSDQARMLRKLCILLKVGGVICPVLLSLIVVWPKARNCTEGRSAF